MLDQHPSPEQKKTISQLFCVSFQQCRCCHHHHHTSVAHDLLSSVPRDAFSVALMYYSFCLFLAASALLVFVYLRWDFGRNLCMNIWLCQCAMLCVCVCVCLPMDYYIIFIHRIHFYSCVSHFFALSLFSTLNFFWCERINYSHFYGLKTERLSCPISMEFYTHNFCYLFFFLLLFFWICAFFPCFLSLAMCAYVSWSSANLRISICIPLWSFCYVTQTQFFFLLPFQFRHDWS